MHTPRSLFVSTWPALAAISLPIVPISCKINGWLSGETGLRGWFAFYLLVWIALSGGTLRTWLRSAPSHQQARIGIIGYGLLLALPCSLFLAFYIAAPFYLERTVKAGLASSLLPLGWLFFAPHYTMAVFSTYRWTKTLLAPLVSGTLSLLLADLTLWTLWSPTPTAQTASDATRRYWTVTHSPGPDGKNLATSYGFYGPEPDPSFKGTRVLVIGDSMPAASRDFNFPKVAEALLRKEGLPIRVVNAAMGGYSLAQIKLFYEEQLKTLRHDVLVLSFYVDDINREFRYARFNRSYTPTWPQWIQDLYRFSVIGKSLMNLCGADEHTIHGTRHLTYDEAFPGALQLIEDIQRISSDRGASFAIFNVPRCTWSESLGDRNDYPALKYDLAVAKWCRDNNVAYKSALDPFLDKPILDYVLSAKDRHYNHAGHTLVGTELSQLLQSLCVPDDSLHSPHLPQGIRPGNTLSLSPNGAQDPKDKERQRPKTQQE